jgi:hypothetical protein
MLGPLPESRKTGGRLNAAKALQPRSVIRNLSTRARIESGDRIMIGGFIIGGFIIGGSGSGTLKVIIRALGPSIQGLSVPKLSDPKIRLNNASGQIASNNNWRDTQETLIMSTGLAPTDNREAAMVQTLPPGPYTVFVEIQSGQPGVGMFEIYELEAAADEQTRLVDVATRCIVGTNEEQAIAGVIIGDLAHPNDVTLPKRSLLIVGKGPSLLSVSGRLANPFLTLNNSVGTQMATNA